MHMGNSNKHEKSKDNQAILGIYDILDGKERGWEGELDFRHENG